MHNKHHSHQNNKRIINKLLIMFKLSLPQLVMESGLLVKVIIVNSNQVKIAMKTLSRVHIMKLIWSTK